MALIGTLRTKMTKWVVGFVALAIVSFILNDLFGSGPTALFGGTDNTIGEIGGKSITLEEFQAAVQDRENNYILNFGRQAGEREMISLRQQAWDLLIARHAIVPEYEKVGVKVPSDEIWDMIQGKNVEESIKSSFVDSAGAFDRNRLIGYIQSLDATPINSEQRIRWDMFKKELSPSRERIKYENLLLKTNFVTNEEGEREYHNQNDVSEVKYLFVPFFAVSDSLVKISEGDLKGYYEKNKVKYKAENKRSISYVAFSIAASGEDTTAIREEMIKLANDFKTVTEDSVFASVNSDGQNSFTKYSISSLPDYLNNQKESLISGMVMGPFLDAGSFKVVKVVKIGTDTIYNAKAKHILIKWDNTTDQAKKTAKDKARKILNEIKAGADFSAKAREFGTDGTASRGGDLGWFPSGQMVKPFEKAVFDAKKTGLLNDVVETDFGYHIISVTELKNNIAYTVATIEREITPSDETQNEAYRKADTFSGDLSGVDNFREKAKKENLAVIDANDLGTAERRVNNLGDARQLVTWLFRDAKIGKVSEVLDLDDNYVVAVMTAETEKGFKPLEKVKEEITPAVRNEQKGKMIAEKLAAQKGTLEEIAKVYPDASIGSSSDLKLNTNNLSTAGFDPIAVGKAFSLDNGKRSLPFVGENGVLIIEMQNKTIAPSIGDYSIFKNQALQNLNNRGGLNIAEAIKEASKIEDKRYKFY
ncbi:MAG: SurA N-terminal domain-containing protein [Bacteroidota bacterium]